MDNITTVGITKEQLKRLKLISVLKEKKIYELISEAVELLERKYNIQIRDTAHE